jgi:predicted nucleic acid-binding protein
MIIALAREDAAATALLAELEPRAYFIVPAPVLCEVLRGGRSDAAVNWVLGKYAGDVVSTNGGAARKAGESLGAAHARSSMAMDALIGATAIAHGVDAVVTADGDDYRALFGKAVEIIDL